MPSWSMIEAFADLTLDGYLGTLGAWVQVSGSLTTRLNAFNTLDEQHIYAGLFDQQGFSVGEIWEGTIPAGRALRLDLATLVPAAKLPFEGAVWVACRGADGKANLGLQAIDLDFIDQDRPDGHILGTVHLMQDFFNTLGIAPWLDLISPRLMVGHDEAGAPRWTNYLGMAHYPVAGGDPAKLEIRVANPAGQWLTAPSPIHVEVFGSAFLSLDALFPTLHEHLVAPGEAVGYGAVNVREITPGKQIGLCAMLKIQDNQTGSLLVDHLNDRHFAKPTQKG